MKYLHIIAASACLASLIISINKGDILMAIAYVVFAAMNLYFIF